MRFPSSARWWSRRWRAIYGAAFVLLVPVFVVVVIDGASIARTALRRFDLAWLFGATGLFASICVLGLFSLLERCSPVGPHKPLPGWMLNLKVTLLLLVVAPIAGAVFGACIGRLNDYIDIGFLDLRFAADGITYALVAFLLSLFIADFFYYWFHRFQHESPLLWQVHKLHHMDEQLSATTALRNHWFEHFLNIPVRTLPIVLLFELDTFSGGVLGLLNLAFVVFYHSNLRIGFGWASPVLVSPQAHRIHHSRSPEHRDKNYAGVFPIFDVLFGTYYAPRRDEYPPTGVHDENDVASFNEAIILPFRGWWSMLREWHRQMRMRSNSGIGTLK